VADGTGSDRAGAHFARYAAEHLEQAAEHLAELVRIPSVKGEARPGAPFGEEVRRAIDAFLARGEREGFAARAVDGAAGHLEWGPPGAPLVGVLAHLDVVPEGDGWTRPAFGAVREGDRLYGRGTSDDKGGAVAAYWALKAVREWGGTPRRRVRLIVGGDEESGFECMERYFAVEEMPVMGFTPDAAFPIVAAEKGIVTFRLTGRLSGDGPTRVVALGGGTRPNVVAASAAAILSVPADAAADAAAALGAARTPAGTGLQVQGGDGADGRGRLEVTASGRAAHGSTPELGANGAAALLTALATVPGLSERDRALLAFLGRAGSDLRGEALGIACADEPSGPLTANLGVISLNGHTLEAQFNLRYPVTERLENLLERARRVAEPLGVSVAPEVHHAPLRADPESELVRTLTAAYRAETGQEARLLAIGGGTYARVLPIGVAFGPHWPEDEERAHGADEYLSLRRLQSAIAIYARAIAGLVGTLKAE
jgi:succinyl-diaminopimelate desuccinylase